MKVFFWTYSFAKLWFSYVFSKEFAWFSQYSAIYFCFWDIRQNANFYGQQASLSQDAKHSKIDWVKSMCKKLLVTQRNKRDKNKLIVVQ